MRAIDVHEQAHQLLEEYESTELATRVSDDGATTLTTRHRVVHPSLLVQLDHCAALASTGDNPSRGADDRAPGSLNALVALVTIKREANALLCADRTYSAERAVRLVYARLDSESRAHIGRWWRMARGAAGWDRPPFRPDNTCPVCAQRGSLRIRVEESEAWCSNEECRSIWSADSIGILAQHIRTENGDVA